MSFFNNLFKTSGTKDLLQKQMEINKLNRQIFRYMSGNTPVWLEDNPEAYIDDAFSFNPDVYSVVSQMIKAASAVPFVVHEVVDEQKARKYKRLVQSQSYKSGTGWINKARQLKEQAFVEVDPNNDLYKLLERPNPLQAWPEFIENLLGFKFVTGNTYAHGVELTDGRFGELWVMPAQYTRIKAGAEVEGLIDGYNLDFIGYEETIPAEQVLHLKYWNPDYSYAGSHLYGMSPLKAFRRAIKNSNDASTALSKSFQNMGAAGMVFPDDPDIDNITEDQRSQIEKFFKQKGGNPDNYKSILATSAKMGWVPFGMSPVDMEVLASIQESRRVICNAYGFPSQLLNDSEKTTYNNIQEARKILYLDIIIPELTRLFSELNRWLVPRFNQDGKLYHLDFDVSGIEALADDMKAKAEWLNIAWWITPEEKRSEMDFGKSGINEFSEPWVGMSQMPVSMITGAPQMTEEEKSLALLEYAKNGVQ